MRIPYKRLLVAISICAVVFIAGCVDTDVNPIPPSIDYQSQMKVVNLVQGAGTATLTLNSQSLGTADFGGETPNSASAFLTIPSGSKTISASFTNAVTDKNQEYKFALVTDFKSRAFIFGTAKTDTFSISSITKSSDTIFVTTSISNSLKKEQQVMIEGVNGMTDLNGLVNVLSVIDTSTFTVLLQTSQIYTGGGKVLKTLINTNLVNVNQRYIWQTKDSPNGTNLFPADTGWVAFFNGSPDAAISTVEVNGEDIHLSPLETGSGSPYVKLPAGTHTFDVYYNDDADHITFDITVASKGRYTAAIYDVAASIKNAVFVDD